MILTVDQVKVEKSNRKTEKISPEFLFQAMIEHFSPTVDSSKIIAWRISDNYNKSDWTLQGENSNHEYIKMVTKTMLKD